MRSRFWALLALVLASCALLSQAPPAGAAHAARWFWVDRGAGPVRVACRLVASKRGASVYVSRDASVSPAQARSLESDFVRHVLPVETKTFGKPHKLMPINLLLTGLAPSTMGYFNENDVGPSGRLLDPSHSNHANVLYMRPPGSMPDSNGLSETKEVAAHELQHLIEYRLRVVDRHLAPESNWLNEGFSFYSQLASGFWTPRDALKVEAAADNPSWQLTMIGPPSAVQSRFARVAYGRVGLFATYLAARYGTHLVRQVLRQRATGLAAVDRVLRRQSRPSRVADAFSDWGVASYMHQSGRYGYGRFARLLRPSPRLVAPPAVTYPFDSTRTIASPGLRPWGQAYLQFIGSRAGTLHLTFTGDSDAFKVAAVVQDSRGAAFSRVLHPSLRGDKGVVTLSGFGSVYDRVTLVVSDVNGLKDSVQPGVLDRYRVEASVDVRYHD